MRPDEARTSGWGMAVSPVPSSSRPYWACPDGPCAGIIDPPALALKRPTTVAGATAHFVLPAGGPLLVGGGEKGGYDPQDLQSAYGIPTTGGEGQAIAIVDAYGYPAAERDLAKYRKRYGLPPCTTADGCFRKVNQDGEEGNYPPAEKSWEGESALDLDMASAACQNCHLLLVEATNAGEDLAISVDTAAGLGATEISNSWGLPEERCLHMCESEWGDFVHPGVLITAAEGDHEYEDSGLGAHSPDYPAALPDVVAVGGTALHRAANKRGWSEEVWHEASKEAGSGSGCSRFPKPAWQTDTGCAGRTENDVAAVAACATPVSVYDTKGWQNWCGTSVATPLVAAIEAHASTYARSLPGAEAFYEDPGAFNDVTLGSNGTCTPPAEDEYLCHAEVGYDGPSGNGTPDGPLALTGAGPTVARVQPASGPESGGTAVTIIGTELTGATSVDFGGNEGSEIRVDSGHELTVLAPPGSGTVTVTVTTPEGTSPVNPEASFTYQLPPTVTTSPVFSYGQHTATLEATVNPNGAAISECRFEYGTSALYGSSAPCSSLPGPETYAVPVSADLGGLAAETVYHYRAVLANALGTSYGSEQTFTTLPPPNPDTPAIGRCLKLTGKAKWKYETDTCTSLSAGQDRGKYEWSPWPVLKTHFTTGTGGGAETPAGARFNCGDSTLSGEFTGPKTASVTIVLGHCSAANNNTLKGTCQSEGASDGEIRFNPLRGELGYVSREIQEGKPVVAIGLRLTPATGTTLASFECGGTAISLAGTVMGSVGPADEMTASHPLQVRSIDFQQFPEGFEEGPASVLTMSVSGVEETAGYDQAGPIVTEEPIEIKTEP